VGATQCGDRGWGNEDISVIKLFQISERKSLEFRMEMFNVPNHVELTASGN
jgi:hypothetical protein